MKKQISVLSYCTMLLAVSVSVDAQQPAKIPRIGYVRVVGTPSTPGPNVDAFRQGLRDLGYVEGKTSRLSFATLRGIENVSQAWWPNSCNRKSMS